MKFSQSGSKLAMSLMLAFSFSVLPTLLSAWQTSHSLVAYADEPTVEKPAPSKPEEPKADKKVESPSKSLEPTSSPDKEGIKSTEEISGVNSDEVEIISITDALKQGQLQHEKNLVDKFLFGIAIIFFVIAFLLFNSLPPSSPEQGNG